MSPSLTLVPTPIGNLEDITLRAIRTLKESEVVLAEDTRQSIKLFQHYQIQTKLVSFHQHNEHQQINHWIEAMKAGKKIALISDAGTPGISDPGFLLVRACLQHNLTVECLPGATAFVPALVKSGIPCNSFVFEGFLPEKKGRQTAIQRICEEKRTVIIYESPHRLLKTLHAFQEMAGPDKRISVSREISKIHEETLTLPVNELIAHFEAKGVKGEFVMVIEGNDK